MRLSEVIGSDCLDPQGRRIGNVYDLRVRWQPGGKPDAFRVTGVVIGPDGLRSHMAHSWGYAEGRALGPWILTRLSRSAIRDARFVPAEAVASWGPGAVEIKVGHGELQPLREALPG